MAARTENAAAVRTITTANTTISTVPPELGWPDDRGAAVGMTLLAGAVLGLAAAGGADAVALG